MGRALLVNSGLVINSGLMKSRLLMRSALLICAVAALLLFTAVAQAANEKVVAVTASQYSYSPNVIQVKKGQTVVLKLTSADKMHGFCLSELNLRTDIKPGKTTELRFVPEKAGTIHFYCDVFCGAGHDTMNGTINVTD